MKYLPVALAVALLASSCADFPRDPEGTLKRIRSEQSFRVGLIAPLADSEKKPEVASFLSRVGSAASARPAIVTGDAESLLDRLKKGELDLVIGRFEKKSPWGTLVEIGPPLSTERQDKTDFLWAPAARNGENAWIALIETQARNSRAGVQ